MPRQREIQHGCARSAFTLVELLVVIAIIGILVALLLPAVQAAREAARRTQCTNQLKQIGLALQNYHDTRKAFPTGRTSPTQLGVAWSYLILPQMELGNIYDAYDKTQRVDAPANATAMRTPIDVYVCPSRRSAAADRDFDNNDQVPVVRAASTAGDYAANAGLEEDIGMEDNDFRDGSVDKTLAGPMFSGSKIASRHVIDGLSNTIAVGEKHIPEPSDGWDPDMIHYRQGDTCFLAADHVETILRGSEDGLAEGPLDRSNQKFGSAHPSVTLFVYLDGHTEGHTNDPGFSAIGVNPNGVDDIAMDEEWFWLGALSTIAGGEIVSE